MNDVADPPRTAAWATRFARAIRLARFPLMVLWAAVIVLGFAAAGDVKYDPDVLVYFDEERPERQAFDAIEERFGRSYEVVTLVAPRSGTVFTPDAVAAMARLATSALSRPEVEAVRSPLDEIDVSASEALAADADGRAGIAAALERLAANPDDDARALIAPDGSLAAVAAIVPAIADNAGVQELAAAHAALRDAVARDFPDLDLPQTGRIVIDAAFINESRDDVNDYASLQLAILAALVLAALGSFTLSLAVLAPVLAVVGGTVGALALTGTPINGISSAAPAVLMGLMVATAVHVVIAWQDALRSGATREEAVAAAYTLNARPVLLSILTTAVSFLVLNTAESPPFRQLGNVVALGLIGILALTFTLLPALLVSIPKSLARHRDLFERAMGALGAAMARGRRLVLTLTAATAALAAWGISNITIDDTFSHYFDDRYEVRRATDLFEEKLSGTTIIDLAVDAGEAGAVLAPGTLERVAEMTAWLAARPEVARVESLATVADSLAAGGEEAGAEAIADAADQMARQGTPRLLGPDARHMRISIVMRGVSSRDTLDFAAATEAEARRLFGEDVAVTGMPVLSARLSIESARSMILGMALALGAISLILMVTLRDAALGAVSLVPNLLPVAMAFGLWGALAGEVSFAATVVGALTYGIVVDDTVHILAKYQRFRRTMNAADAIRTAFRSVGVAVVVTSLALALSFLPFALSGFLVNHHFGALTALTLLAALLADLVFLPALLAAVEQRRPQRPSAALATRPAK